MRLIERTSGWIFLENEELLYYDRGETFKGLLSRLFAAAFVDLMIWNRNVLAIKVLAQKLRMWWDGSGSRSYCTLYYEVVRIIFYLFPTCSEYPSSWWNDVNTGNANKWKSLFTKTLYSWLWSHCGWPLTECTTENDWSKTFRKIMLSVFNIYLSNW